MDLVIDMQISRRDFLIKSFSVASTILVSASFMNLSNMNICIFSKHLQWLDPRRMADLVRNIGFSGIDLTVRSGGHVNPDRVEIELPEIVSMIRNEGLEVPIITTSITDAEDIQTRKILETAGKLGIKIYRTGWYRYNGSVKVLDLIDHARSQMEKLGELNRECNIRSAYQNHAGTYLGSSGWDLYRIVEGLDPEWTGVQFDIRHAMVEGPESWLQVLELLAPYINSIDIKDFRLKTEKNKVVIENVPLGSGVVDQERFFNQVSDLRIRAELSLHCEYPLGGAEHGQRDLSISEKEFRKYLINDLEYLRNILRFER